VPGLPPLAVERLVAEAEVAGGEGPGLQQAEVDPVDQPGIDRPGVDQARREGREGLKSKPNSRPLRLIGERVGFVAVGADTRVATKVAWPVLGSTVTSSAPLRVRVTP